MPSRSLGGLLVGLEPEVRQATAILLLERYFKGNTALASATQRHDESAIASQMSRSINGAIRSSMRDLNRQMLTAMHRAGPMPEEEGIAAHDHPADLPFSEFGLRERKEVALAKLQEAVIGNAVSEENAEIAREIIELGLSQTEIASAKGITRQAVNQRIKSVERCLRKAVEEKEL